MGIREILKRNQLVAGVLTIVVSFAAVGLTYWQMAPARLPKPPNQRYFVHDGDTQFEQCFTDSLDQVPPFVHDGKPAYRAYVFNSNGRNTVLFLQKMTDPAKKDLEKPGKMPVHVRMQMDVGRTLVKKPADKQWVPMLSPQGLAIMKSNNGIPEIVPDPN